jgi:K(+)-stimulated pyrophosphate-energized sodium pump
VPVAVGFIGGAEMLGGLLAGVTTCGVLMAIFQSNAGGAWDNAKKTIEEQGKKGTDAHKAAVVGDTVGDPFKDTSGPSLNILLKLMSVVALVIAPSIAITADGVANYIQNKEVETEISTVQNIDNQFHVEMTSEDINNAKAIVTISTTKAGVTVNKEVIFEGTLEEVNQSISNLKEEKNS